MQSCGELASKQVPLPNSLHEGSVPLQFLAVMLVGVKNSDWHVQYLSDYPYRLCEVGIVRYKHRHLELLAESVSNEM